MDKYNTFHTPAAYRLMRLDYFSVLVALSAAVLYHASDVNWIRFAIAFAWIDLVGTLPAWYVYYARRKGEHRSIPQIFYTLYNTCHSFTTNLAIIGAWYFITGAWEWAMLAGPLHLLGDRSVFGNVYKPGGLSFEPVPFKEYSEFLGKYERAGQW